MSVDLCGRKRLHGVLGERRLVGAVGIELLFNFIKSHVFTVLPTASQMNWSQMELSFAGSPATSSVWEANHRSCGPLVRLARRRQLKWGRMREREPERRPSLSSIDILHAGRLVHTFDGHTFRLRRAFQ